MKQKYFKTNKELSVKEVEDIKKMLDNYFGIDYNVTISAREIIFSEE